ncbi:hypothetical protein B296_00008800 [Ensete ventricosum]|uniref:Uncharacterized protein n=1 Tax=Ensete ventricosum TaxID=4639 RepID=A0A426ZPH7_ENSVE|nr:hypothetical protein B296_00008800 [Ensete ventricosum]
MLLLCTGGEEGSSKDVKVAWLRGLQVVDRGSDNSGKGGGNDKGGVAMLLCTTREAVVARIIDGVVH